MSVRDAAILERLAGGEAPPVLAGDHARLEPIEAAHAADLYAAGDEPELWLFMGIPGFADLAAVASWISEARAARGEGCYAIIDRREGRAVGSTRLLDIRPRDRSLEIGWTWLGAKARRTPINTECKLLLLRFAFERAGAVRVCLKTDARNARSRAAIERLGAVSEGVLRRHRAVWNGGFRDTAYYSVLDDEWPAVKARLQARLHRRHRDDPAGGG